MSLRKLLTSRTVLAHAVAGSAGGMLAMTICYPLDRIRTMAQVREGKIKSSVFVLLMELLKTEGWTGMYAGLGPALIALGTSNFVYFYCYTALKAILQKLMKSKAELSGVANLLLASIAGTINVMVTAPLWLAVTRLSIQSKSMAKGKLKKAVIENQYKGISDCLQRTYREEGLRGLWSGTIPSLILVSNPSVQFASYERLKSTMLAFRNSATPQLGMNNCEASTVAPVGVEVDPLSGSDYMVIGATAKLIATVVTYPLQVAQTRIRAEKLELDENGKLRKKYSGTLDCLLTIFQAEGLGGLYRGMDAKILQTCSTSAFMFVFYEKISSLIFSLMLKRKLSLD